ncbi:MAG: hypothetical protein GY702_13505, partial [Desulfobulbaceae bacterium]|nr:hypothetical protein [Desulfobulbaceae bacterium]
MGTLEELYDLRQSAEKFKEQPDAVYAIWQVPAHQVGPISNNTQSKIQVPLVLDQGIDKNCHFIYQVSEERADVVFSDQSEKGQDEGSEYTSVPKSCFHMFTSGDQPPNWGSSPASIFGISKGSYTPVEQEIVNIFPAHMRCMLPPSGVLGVEHLERVANLIVEYQDVFVGADGKVGYTDIMTHKINTGDTEPIKARTRKKSFLERDHITKEVAKMLSSGQIKPSNSP